MTNIHWADAVDGAFDNAADWKGDAVPGPSDDAILDATGARFTVTATSGATVEGVQLASNATLAISKGAFVATAGTDGGANAGTIAVTGGAMFQTGGILNNSGGITLSGAGSELRLLSDTTLTGGGDVSANYGTYGNYTQVRGGAPVTLTNIDNTISGAGQIGGSAGFSLVNEAGGVIEADVYQRRLILGSSSYAGTRIVNDGLLQAAAGQRSPSSFLEIDQATVTGAGGTIAAGADSNVTIMNSRVSGQTFTIARGGTFQIFHSRVKFGGALDDPSLLQLTSDVVTIKSGLTLTGGGTMEIHGGSVVGSKAGATLTNVDGFISLFKGNLGGGKLTLVNQALGTIECEGTIDTGARAIINAGLIDRGSFGWHVPGVIISAIENTGTLSTGEGGTLVFEGAVTGSGQAMIASTRFGGGVLDFRSDFNQDVTFAPEVGRDGVGVLELARSQAYAAAITGFSKGGRTSLDLGDIGFVKASRASFSGTKTSGVLTVTDGTHTAHIELIGDFLASTFVVSSDGHGGVSIATKTKDAPSASSFVSAMASLGGAPATPVHDLGFARHDGGTALLAPRASLALA